MYFDFISIELSKQILFMCLAQHYFGIRRNNRSTPICINEYSFFPVIKQSETFCKFP